MVAVTTKWIPGRESRRREISASLPTPLGPLITMTRGLGFGMRGSEVKEEPKEASRARRSSERSALSREGMGTGEGRRASPMWVVELWRRNEKLLGFGLRSGGGGARDGNGRRVREEFKSLRIMEEITVIKINYHFYHILLQFRIYKIYKVRIQECKSYFGIYKMDTGVFGLVIFKLLF